MEHVKTSKHSIPMPCLGPTEENGEAEKERRVNQQGHTNAKVGPLSLGKREQEIDGTRTGVNQGNQRLLMIANSMPIN